jgi:hypothetical protein
MFRDINKLLPSYCLSSFGEEAKGMSVDQLIDYEMLTPYVELYFPAYSFSIKTGNNSSPDLENTASIQRFTYSMGQSWKAVFVIKDTDGGNFTYLYNSLRFGSCSKDKPEDKDKAGSAKAGYAYWDFGWIGTDSFGNEVKISASQISYSVNIPGCGETKIDFANSFAYGTIVNIEAKVDKGIFEYTLEIISQTTSIFQATKKETVFGKEEAPQKLLDAIKQMCSDACGTTKNADPSIVFIFGKKNNDGTVSCNYYSPKDGGAKGPAGVWPVSGMSLLDAITEFKNNYLDQNGKGQIYTVEATNPAILMMIALPEGIEDPAPNEAKNPNVNNRAVKTNPIATYIVNGGNNSNVFSYTPKINYMYLSSQNAGAGGNAGGAAGPPQGINQNPAGGAEGAVGNVPAQNNKDGASNSGPQVRIPVRQYDLYNQSPMMITKNKALAYVGQAKTMNVVEQNAVLEAELIIQGDPKKYARFVLQNGYMPVGIIFINPFQVGGSMQNDAPNELNWLAWPACNAVFTKKMTIFSITHNIEGGTYKTTLGLKGYNTPSQAAENKVPQQQNQK